jgi:protoheme IX farnesyltransferase
MLVQVTFTMGPAAGLSWIYYASSVGLGAWFIFLAYQLWRRPADVPPIRLYKFSLLYLALLFVAMGVDAAVFA